MFYARFFRIDGFFVNSRARASDVRSVAEHTEILLVFRRFALSRRRPLSTFFGALRFFTVAAVVFISRA